MDGTYVWSCLYIPIAPWVELGFSLKTPKFICNALIIFSQRCKHSCVGVINGLYYKSTNVIIGHYPIKTVLAMRLSINICNMANSINLDN